MLWPSNGTKEVALGTHDIYVIRCSQSVGQKFVDLRAANVQFVALLNCCNMSVAVNWHCIAGATKVRLYVEFGCTVCWNGRAPLNAVDVANLDRRLVGFV
jgi:hypothetical protein